jgi:MerR family mercuric resistance operon transcriptional regulator
MNDKQENMSIGAFAKVAGVNVETIRFYPRKGLLPEPARPYGSIRRYGVTDVGRMRFVKSAQRLGFSLDEVSELLQLEDGAHCGEASVLAEAKLRDVQLKLTDLQRMEAVLSALVTACHAKEGEHRMPVDSVLPNGSLTAWHQITFAANEAREVLV